MSRNISFLGATPAILLVTALTGCAPLRPRAESQQREAAKIEFQMDHIRPDGLRGPPDGLTLVAYEFCVPADERIYQEVMRIDPSLEIQPGGRGRIGCGNDQALCIGQTHQPRWREVLKRLASLPYIAEIREGFFE
jgi:hypothetical protein